MRISDWSSDVCSSDLSSDGVVIRLNFPQLTEERRRDYVKVVKQKAEDGRVQIRNARRHARQELEALQKDGDISEDDLARAEKEFDKITQAREAERDKPLDEKEQRSQERSRGNEGVSTCRTQRSTYQKKKKKNKTE